MKFKREATTNKSYTQANICTLFVCLFACLLVCLFACLMVCVSVFGGCWTQVIKQFAHLRVRVGTRTGTLCSGMAEAAA